MLYRHLVVGTFVLAFVLWGRRYLTDRINKGAKRLWKKNRCTWPELCFLSFEPLGLISFLVSGDSAALITLRHIYRSPERPKGWKRSVCETDACWSDLHETQAKDGERRRGESNDSNKMPKSGKYACIPQHVTAYVTGVTRDTCERAPLECWSTKGGLLFNRCSAVRMQEKTS